MDHGPSLPASLTCVSLGRRNRRGLPHMDGQLSAGRSAVQALLVVLHVKPEITGGLKEVLGDQQTDLEVAVPDVGDGLPDH